jgi:hypothetical protein
MSFGLSLEERASIRGVAVRTLLFQDRVESDVERRLFGLMRERVLPLNSYVKYLIIVDNQRGLSADWGHYYTRLMVRAFRAVSYGR